MFDGCSGGDRLSSAAGSRIDPGRRRRRRQHLSPRWQARHIDIVHNGFRITDFGGRVGYGCLFAVDGDDAQGILLGLRL